MKTNKHIVIKSIISTLNQLLCKIFQEKYKEINSIQKKTQVRYKMH